MPEQITLFDEALTPETLGGKLEDILEAAREKSGYYKLHESGMYEMTKGAPASELYDILEIRNGKSGDISFYFDGQLYIKFLVKKEALNTTKELFAELLSNHESEQLSGNEAPKKGVRVILPIDQQVEFFKQALDYLIRTKRPVNRFACCSQYQKCSQANACTNIPTTQRGVTTAKILRTVNHSTNKKSPSHVPA
ncbi:MAG: hypothetical protein KH345_15140 [Eubacterium sp.]|nr:hypothetical protein [Eubacterium sp.]